MNVLDRGPDPGFEERLLSPGLYALRRRIISLRDVARPLTVGGSYLQGGVRRVKTLLVPTTPSSTFLPPDRRASNVSAIFGQLPSSQKQWYQNALTIEVQQRLASASAMTSMLYWQPQGRGPKPARSRLASACHRRGCCICPLVGNEPLAEAFHRIVRRVSNFLPRHMREYRPTLRLRRLVQAVVVKLFSGDLGEIFRSFIISQKKGVETVAVTSNQAIFLPSA
jgi:hypothetical protein